MTKPRPILFASLPTCFNKISKPITFPLKFHPLFFSHGSATTTTTTITMHSINLFKGPQHLRRTDKGFICLSNTTLAIYNF